jgi:hypothetical protein
MMIPTTGLPHEMLLKLNERNAPAGKQKKRPRGGRKKNIVGGKKRKDAGQREIEGGEKKKLFEDGRQRDRLPRPNLQSSNSVRPPTTLRPPGICLYLKEGMRRIDLEEVTAGVVRTVSIVRLCVCLRLFCEQWPDEM